MTKYKKETGILRLIDANLNRLLEGLRVCEEITRFIACDERLTAGFKSARHKVVSIIKGWDIDKKLLLESRDSKKDIGKGSIKPELIRKDCKNIFFANIQRSKESLRVLEEFAKLDNARASSGFKDLRYELYDVEKKALSNR